MKQLYTIFFIILIGRIFAQPVNDDPCGALPLSVNISCTSTTESTATATTTASVPDPSCGTVGKDTWYSFVAPPAGTITIKTSDGSITDGVMAVYSGASCASLTEIACNDDFGPSDMPKLTLSSLTPGATYYIRFWKKTTGAGTFDICLFDLSAVVTYTNNDCAGATQICSTTSFTDNSGGDGIAHDLDAANHGCLVSEEHQSAWYYWQIATSGTLTFSINPDIPSDDYDFGIWGPTSLCPAADPARCSYSAVDGNTGLNTIATDLSEDAGGDAWVKFMNVAAGSFYIICVDNFLSTGHGFSFSFGGTATINCDPVVLPVVLTSFTVIAEQSTNLLQWTTSSEHNTDFFSIEKSTDGINFIETGKVKASGYSTSKIDYSFRDYQFSYGSSYYRLYQMDADGSGIYSNIVHVMNTSAQTMAVYPNPSSGYINIACNIPDGNNNMRIDIFSAYGQPVFKKELEGSGYHLENVKLPSKGIFWVVTQCGDNRQVEKVTY